MMLICSRIGAASPHTLGRPRRGDFADDGPMEDYELLDVGGAARLERFGMLVTDRPHGGALTDRRDPKRWASADLRFDRDRGWAGPGLEAAVGGWTINAHGIALELRTTEAGQVGLFPEHLDHLPWLAAQVASRRVGDREVEVLNLFAYTGLATLALAREGARVTHVDASRPAVTWARRNAAANELQDRPIRWIVEDARAYVDREIRRGRRYDGIVLDPPTYGHGAGGSTSWRLDEGLADLLAACANLLADDGFLLLTAHTEGFGPGRLAAMLAAATDRRDGRAVESGTMELIAATGATLDLGAYARSAGRG
jgi:23S rRNA (cytosine1962-C5)-methyltransferase